MTKVPTRITPDIDAVIQARITAMKRAEESRRTAVGSLPFVTVSREFGCEGYAVSQALAEALTRACPRAEYPWMVFDKEIIARISEESGHFPGLVSLVAEEKLSMIGHVFIDLLSRLPDDYEIYQRMAKSICILAQKGNAIIVGRGSASITQDIEGGVHVRLVAPFDFRVDRIARSRSLGRAEAEKVVRRMERERDAFVQKFTMRSADDPYLYHLIFNNARCSAAEIAGTTLEFMRARHLV